MITLRSSHGDATFDSTTGALIADDLSVDEWPLANHPHRLDLEALKRDNPGYEILAEDEFDILCMPYWTVDGQYAPAVLKINGVEM